MGRQYYIHYSNNILSTHVRYIRYTFLCADTELILIHYYNMTIITYNYYKLNK